MELQYLGTAAAEGWPAMFCKCERCEEARRLGGRNVRTRSQAVVDGKLLLDFPADSYWHAVQYGVDFAEIEHILITHSHADHLYPDEFIYKNEGYAPVTGASRRISIHSSPEVAAKLSAFLPKSGFDSVANVVALRAEAPFEPFRAGEYTVTPLLAEHMRDETCYFYIIEKEGKSLVYAHDTGYFPEETWKFLEGKRFGLFSLDCTYGEVDERRGHMGLPAISEIRARLLKMGCADEKTLFVANHFSHNSGPIYDRFAPMAKEQGFLTSYDGMRLDF